MNKELLKKIQNEEPLTLEESLILEKHLAEQDQAGVGSFVGSIQDPEPSMAWRSELNEKLHEIRPKESSKKKPWYVIPGFAVGTTAIIAVAVIFLNQNQTSVESPQQVATQDETVSSLIISGHIRDELTLTAGMSVPKATLDSGYDWSELEAVPD